MVNEKILKHLIKETFYITNDIVLERTTAKAMRILDYLLATGDNCRLHALISDINPKEISAQIGQGTLEKWCSSWQKAAMSELLSRNTTPASAAWIKAGGVTRCSSCFGRAQYYKEQGGVYVPVENRFCPNCGAKMLSEDDFFKEET